MARPAIRLRLRPAACTPAPACLLGLPLAY
jgi:hypothetical protein